MTQPRIQPRQLEAFRHVMMSGGITAAAESMNITQPAVSRLIRDLELSVRFSLFERRSGRLVPTAEARLLLGETDRLYHGLDQIAQAAEDIREHKNTVLRIGCLTSIMRPFLQQAIISVVGARKDIPLVIDVENSRHIWEMVDNNRYDLGFAFSAPIMDGKNAELLRKVNAVAAMAPDHPLAARATLSPQDLGEERLLWPGRNSPLRRALERTFLAENFTPVSSIETSMLNCCHFAAQGLGIGIVDEISIKAADLDIVARPFTPQIELAYYAIRPTEGRRVAVIDDIVREVGRLLNEGL